MSTMSGFILDIRLYATHLLWSGALLSSTGLADALPGVSAQALITLPELRGAHGRAIRGPTQSELKRVFLGAVEAALARSHALGGARAEHEAALADVDEIKGRRWPQVDLGSQSRAHQFGGGVYSDPATNGGVNVQVTTSVFDWGYLGTSIESRQQTAMAMALRIDAEAQRAAHEVTATLIELGKQRLIVQLSEQYASRLRELVAMLAEVVMADPGRSSELTQAKARLLQAEAALDTARTRVADQQVNLHKLVGDRHVALPVGQEWNLHPGDLPALLGDIPDHPLVQQARSRTAAAQLQAEAVKVSALPQLNWTINKSTREDAWGREQPWQTALSVNWPIFRGGAVRAAERAALQRAEAGRQELEQLRRDLEYSLRTAHQEALALFERAELYQALMLESEQIRGDFFEQWYHLGRRTLLDVLSAESDYYGNRVSAVSNRFDAYHATVRQYSSAGSLFKWLRSRQ